MTDKAVDSKRWIIIGLLSLGAIIAYIDRANISVALAVPDFIQTFHLSDIDRGMLNSAFFWSYTVLQIPAGWIVDRYGVKIPYAIGFLFWCLAAAGTALTRSLSQLTTMRVFLGAGEAVVVPASYRWIRYNFAEKERGLAMGLYMTGTKIASAIGAPIAAWLIMVYSWRLMFVILGLSGLLWLIPWMFLIKEKRPAAELVTPAKEVASAAVPVGKILASPVVLGSIIVNFCYMYFTFFCITWMPAYFVEARHLSLSKMSLYTFFSFAGMAILATLAGWAADRLIARGWKPVPVRKGFVIAGFAIASTELIGAQSSSVEAALFWAVVSLSGLGLASANSLALTRGTLIPASAVGLVSGVQNGFGSAAGIVGPILTGWLKQTFGSYQAPMQAIWFFMMLGILSCVVLLREKYAPKVPAVAATSGAAGLSRS
jgi:ACS family D-galactonate transporter-like MFS transporter